MDKQMGSSTYSLLSLSMKVSDQIFFIPMEGALGTH